MRFFRIGDKVVSLDKLTDAIAAILEEREAGATQMETALHHHLMGKPDAIEGVVAHLEKRPPRWQLRVSRDWPEWPKP